MKDGTKRFEIRHVNDLKFPHPKSLAAPAVRPRLGRPAGTSSSLDSKTSTEETAPVPASPSPSNRFLLTKQLPNPPSSQTSKQAVATGNAATKAIVNHETSISGKRQPASELDSGLAMSGPPPSPPFPARPVRATRNPSPYYVDSIQLVSCRPWSASQDEVSALNRAIGG